MSENFSNESKNKWTRIFKKKWFFPALYIAIAAFLLTAVVWYQTIENQLIGGIDEEEETDSYQSDLFDEEAETVLHEQETIQMPVKEGVQSEIVTKFYDYNAAQEDQEKGLTLYNNRYYQSTGIDIASSDGESFDVVASLSGTVKEVKEDPLLGHVVVLTHGDEVETYYASLGEVTVETGKEVLQGDKIGTAGQNLFSEESGIHVHFEIHKGETEVNPEQFFNEPLSALSEYDIAPNMEETNTVEEESEIEENENKDDQEKENNVSFSTTA